MFDVAFLFVRRFRIHAQLTAVFLTLSNLLILAINCSILPSNPNLTFNEFFASNFRSIQAAWIQHIMAAIGEEDPFLQVQADVLSLLNQTRPLFSSYLRIRSTASSANSQELIDARKDLETTLRDLNTDLEDLTQSVRAVEKDPYRYGLEIDEVERRRRLVVEVGGEIEDMREELQKTVHEAQNKGKAAVNDDVLPDPESFAAEEEDDYSAWEQGRQQELMHEQDEALDDVFKTVGNLRAQADDMGRELEDQTHMLGDVETVADRVGGKLQTGIKKVGMVIKKNEDRWSSCCIGLLIVILIFMLVILLII